jgi:HD-like signal output (HDOD) protein
MAGLHITLITWLKRCFGMEAVSAAAPPVRRQPAELQPQDGTIPPAPAVAHPLLPKEARNFLLALLEEQQPNDLQALSLYERAYILNLMEMLRSKTFEIPLLPEGAVRMQKLLSDPRASAAEFVEIFKVDPALSAALIRMANSSFYGATEPVHDLQLAVSRIGLTQLQGLVIMMSLRTRVLHSKSMQREVDWLTELSLQMALACQQLAAELALPPGEAFTRGLLHHVEYFAILGVTARYMSSHQGEAVSAAALSEAIRRLGRPVHELLIQTWGLEMLELQELFPLKDDHDHTDEGESQTDMRVRLDKLQRLLITAWAGGKPELKIEGFQPESLRRAIEVLFPGAVNKNKELKPREINEQLHP